VNKTHVPMDGISVRVRTPAPPTRVISAWRQEEVPFTVEGETVVIALGALEEGDILLFDGVAVSPPDGRAGGPSGGTGAGRDSSDSAGCGCRMADPRRSGTSAALLLALLALVRAARGARRQAD
jgi:MYXO-CTERM domain-containing protein